MVFSLTTYINKILKKRSTLLISAIASIAFGLYCSDVSKNFSYISKFYISFLQLSIIPILTTSIMLATRKLAISQKKVFSLPKSILAFFLLLVAVGIIGIAFSSYGNFGGQIAEKHEIQELLVNSGYSNAIELKKEDPIEKQAKTTAWNFIIDIMPGNIVQSLSNGYILQILSFSILFGMALGKIREDDQSIIVKILESANAIFQKTISWAIHLLPIGLFFIIASQIAYMSKDVILSMGYFVLTVLMMMIVLTFIVILMIWKRSSCTFMETLIALKEPSLVSVATSSSITALPSLTQALHNLKFDKEGVNLLTPLCVSTCRYGTTLYFSLVAVFIAQVYHVPLTGFDFFIIIVGAILGSLVAASTGVVNLKLISFILDPLGIPLNLALILFIAIDSLIDPIRTLLTVLFNGAAIVFSLPRGKSSCDKNFTPMQE